MASLGESLFGNRYERGSVLPVVRDRETGQRSFGAPQALVDVLRALALPGDVYAGETQVFGPDGHVAPDVIKRGADLAGSLAVGAPATAGAVRMATGERLVDPAIVNMFAGPNARTADKDALALAQMMAGAGVDRTAIWNSTGWFKGTDGKWRFEIDDSQARFSLPAMNDIGEFNTTGGAFDDVLDHKALMDAYPDMMAHGTSSVDIAPGSRNSGAYHPRNNAIYAAGPDAESAKSTFLHEIQHAIQRVEGTAIGGNPKEFLSGSAQYAPGADAWEQYRRLAGEAEARNVQTRRDFTPAQRKARPPWTTLDVPESEQTVRFRR